jgi:hypothetical protein
MSIKSPRLNKLQNDNMVSEFIFLYIEDCISVLTSSVVDLWFEPQLGQTKYSKIWNCPSQDEKTCHSTFLCYKNICVTAERCKNMCSKNTNMDTQWCLPCPCYSKIWNCSFPAKHTALLSKGNDWLVRNQGNVSQWNDMCTHGLLFQWATTIKIQLRALVITVIRTRTFLISFNIF